MSISHVSGNENVLVRRRRKGRLTAIREGRIVNELRAVEVAAENERRKIEMKEEMVRNLERIKQIYVEKQRELALRQEEERRREDARRIAEEKARIKAEEDERIRQFIEARKLAREEQRKKLIDAARQKAEEVVKMTELAAAKKKIELEKERLKAEEIAKDKAVFEALRREEIQFKLEDEEKRLKLHKAEILATKKEFEDERKKETEEKTAKTKMVKTNLLNLSEKSSKKLYDIEFTKDRQEIKKRKQAEEEAKIRAAEEDKLRAIDREKRKLEKEAKLAEEKKRLKLEQKKLEEEWRKEGIRLAKENAERLIREEAEREALREEERRALEEYMREAEEAARLEELRWEEELRVQLAKEKDREYKKIEKEWAEAEAERLKLEEEEKRIEKERHDTLEKALNEVQQKAVDDYVKKLEEKRRMNELYNKNKTEWRLALAESLEQAKQNYKLKMQQMDVIEETDSIQSSSQNFDYQKNKEEVEETIEESDRRPNESGDEINMEKALVNIKRKASGLAKKRAKELSRQSTNSSIESSFVFKPEDLVSILNDFSFDSSTSSRSLYTNTSTPYYSSRNELPLINTSRKMSNSQTDISMEDALKNIKKKARELSELKLKNNKLNVKKESSVVYNKLDFSKLYTNESDYESDTERKKLLKNIKIKARELSKSKLSFRGKIEYGLTSRSEQDLRRINHEEDRKSQNNETLDNESRYYALGLEGIR